MEDVLEETKAEAKLVRELEEYGIKIEVCDPMAHAEDAKAEYGITLLPMNDLPPADAVVAAVSHQAFRDLTPSQLRKLLKDKPVFIDVKGSFSKQGLGQEGIAVWRL